MRFQHRWIWAAILVVTLASCKKDEEKRAPVVSITAPTDGFDLTVPDTLSVVADISASDDIDDVTFMITDANGIPAAEIVQVFPSGNPAHVEVRIPLVSELIAGGDYTLTVQASDGDTHGKDYCQLDIIPAPLRLRRLLVVSASDPGTVNVHIIDSTGAVSLANSLSLDLGGAALSSPARTLAVMGTVQGPLLALGPDGVQVAWQKQNLGNAGIPWFTSLDLATDARYYVGTTDGYLRGYNAVNGSTEFIANFPVSKRVLLAERSGTHLMVVLQDQTGADWSLGVYQSGSGTSVAEHPLDKRVLAMFSRDDDNVLLFGNRDDQGVVEDRNVDVGGGWEPRIWGSPITAVERVDANTFLVALEDGSIERFTYSNAGSLTIAAVNDVHDLSLDPVSGLVYAGCGTQVIAIEPQTGQTTAMYPIGSAVQYVLPLLNR